MVETIVCFLTISPFLLQEFLLLIVYKNKIHRETYKSYLFYIITVLNIASVLAYSMLQGQGVYIIESTSTMFIIAILTVLTAISPFLKI